MSNKADNLKTLRDVTFYYAFMDQPRLQFEKKADPTEPMKNKEWTIQVLVSNKTFKQLKKAYPKAPNIKNAEDIEQKDFAKYANDKLEELVWPFEEDSCVRVKFTQKSWFDNAGRAANQPPVLGIVGKVKDRNGVAVGNGVPIGNGTKGHLQFTVYEGDKGHVLYLSAICITELVEYSGSGGSGVNFDDFGIEEDESADTDDFGDDSDDDPFA